MQKKFSYPLKLEDMSASAKKYIIKADSVTLPIIAEILKLNGIKRFEAEVNVKLNKKAHLVNVFGFVDAEVEEISVISLDAFVHPYHADFSLQYDTKLTEQDINDMDLEFNDEVPDILVDNQIDLAAVAMEQLALVLDDFPRKEGEVFSFKSEFDEETTLANNPFAVLKKIKK